MITSLNVLALVQSQIPSRLSSVYLKIDFRSCWRMSLFAFPQFTSSDFICRWFTV